MAIEGYFSIKRDKELIAAGTHFWCQACVVARPLVEQSSDPRYCLACYDVLMDEASLLPPTKKPARRPGGADNARKAPQTTPAGGEVVAKLIPQGKPPIAEKQVVMQHPGGRPRKQGEVHRVTKWRRAKQEALL